jgi:hypothetical protein
MEDFVKYDKDFFKDLDDEMIIEKYKLETEWAHQPQLYLKYAMASAYFQKIASECAEKVKIMEANLRADAAEDPDTCLGRGVKATGERCESYATSHPTRVQAKQEAIEAKYASDAALGAVFAMNQRKDALENLVKLQSMEIYSEPKTNSRDFESRTTQKAASDAIKNSGVLRRKS